MEMGGRITGASGTVRADARIRSAPSIEPEGTPMLKRFQLAAGALLPSDSDEASVLLYVSPDASERETLRAQYQLDEHTLMSALDPDEVSRIEFAPDRMFLIWKRPTNYSGKDTFFFNVASMGLLLLEQRLIVIVNEPVPFPGSMRPRPSLRGPMDVLLEVLLNPIQHYLEHLKVIKMIARDLQQKINLSMENKHLIQMFNLSESLVYYLNAIDSNGVVLARLRTHAEKAGMPRALLDLLDDLAIENNQCYRQAEIYSTVFSGLMDARGNLVNNNMNVLLKNLTLINVVFLPLNLIASIGGMSEYSMMTHGVDWRISYALFGLAMLGVGWITARVLRRMDFGGTAPRPRRPAGPRPG
jgi:magnesium transporter